MLTFRRDVYFVCFAWTTLIGCNHIKESSKVCIIGSREGGTSDSTSVQRSIIFTEDEGSLFAKLLQCGDKEYYLGSFGMSNSSIALGSGFAKKKGSKHVDNTITCSDAVSTYPYNQGATTALLMKLCREAEEEYPRPR